MLELLAVLEHLSGVLRSEAAHDWLFMPNASLEHHEPADLLRAGEFRAVIGAIDARWQRALSRRSGAGKLSVDG